MKILAAVALLCLLCSSPALADKLRLGDIELYYALHGDVHESARPLLLLHGALQDSGDWDAQIATLSEKYPLIVAETRGHGRSGYVDAVLSYELFAQDMFALLDHLGVDKTHVLGWSDGGNTALEMARVDPERIDRIVAVGANFRSDESAIRAEMVQYMRAVQPEMMVPAMLQKWPEYPNPEAMGAFLGQMQRMILEEPGWDAATLVTIPTAVLLVAGDSDIILPSHSVEMHNALPNSQLWLVPATGHDVPTLRPAAFNAAVLRFLQGGSAAGW